MAPRVFVSYDREAGEPLVTWVKTFVDALRTEGGADARVDLVDPEAGAGRDLAKYLQDNLHAADAVLLICTPGYIARLNAGTGPVSFEASLLSGERLRHGSRRPIVAVVQDGDPQDVVPPWGLGTPIDLRGEVSARAAWETLLDALHPDRRPAPADVDPPPERPVNQGQGRFALGPAASPRRWMLAVLLLGLLGAVAWGVIASNTPTPVTTTQPPLPATHVATSAKPPPDAAPKAPSPPSSAPKARPAKPSGRRVDLQAEGGTAVGGHATIDAEEVRMKASQGGTVVGKNANVTGKDVKLVVTGTGSVGIRGDAVFRAR